MGRARAAFGRRRSPRPDPVPTGPVSADVEPGPEGVGSSHPTTAACAAPATNLRFEPDGSVVACCVNSRFPLGHVSMASIREIWEGVRIRELGGALDAGDFSLGCQDCAVQIEAGRRSASYAPTFDPFARSASPDWPRRLEFAVSNRCNLMCVQCSGRLSSAIRARREHLPPFERCYGEAFFAELEGFLEHAEATVFLGGEPFLQPEVWRIWDQLLALAPTDRPTVDVTTNGTIWNDRIERYVRELAMTVAVSIDAVDPAVAEAIRIGSRHGEVLDNLRSLRNLVRETGGGFGINACLMRDNWQELPALLALGDELDAAVEVIVVSYPHEHSLLFLPTAELADVVAALEAVDRDRRADLGRNRPQWDATLSQLRAHAVGQVAVPVEISVRPVASDFMSPPQRRMVQRLLVDERDRLTTAAGAAPVEIVAVDGTVREVIDRPWAADLAVGTWVGSGVEQLLDHLTARLGGPPVVETSPLGTDLVRVDLVVADHRFAIVVAEWLDGAESHLRALVSEVAA